jgi:putative flavoprotein involved in K+ transport
MQHVDTLIIGGGQAGLALSRSLTERRIEHVVLERGRVGERWRTERWDSLRLLTPRWLSRLSGWDPGDGSDPAGFMLRAELVGYLEAFASAFRAPVREGVTVQRLEQTGAGFQVWTDHGGWRADRVVVATGQSQAAFVPELASRMPIGVLQVVPTEYRNPHTLPEGGVLVVGASATGIQLAEEIHASGRPVTLSVGRHTRLPRSYRGRDILFWLHDMGVLDQPADAVADLSVSRDQPSMQLVGTPDRRTLDLGILAARGVRLTGRAVEAEAGRVHFADDLAETLAAADWKLAGLRLRIDRHVRSSGAEPLTAKPEPFVPVPLLNGPRDLDLAREGIRTVVWATGFRRDYPWLRVPVLDPRGEIIHRRGITPVPGLCVLGLNLLRRRSSSFLSGVGADAEEIADHLLQTRTGVRAIA